MKKIFKKLIALTSAVSLTALSVAGCGGSSQTSADAGKGSEQSQPLQKQSGNDRCSCFTGYVRWYGLHTGG